MQYYQTVDKNKGDDIYEGYVHSCNILQNA
jgi:hypothetical protein